MKEIFSGFQKTSNSEIAIKKEKAEKEKKFNPHFYITDHSPDFPDTGSPENLRELYAGVKNEGIQSVRYDWRWKSIEPAEGNFDKEQLARYSQAKEIMSQVGLDEPTIILSSAPAWAEKLYKEDKEKFFESYRQYVEQVKKTLVETGGRVERVQIFNELNNSVYTKIEVEDLPRVCRITREVLADYNPDVKLMATIVAGSLPEAIAKIGSGKNLENFLPKLKEIKDSFDIIAVDYYPGLWHLPMKEAGWSLKNVYKQMGLLKKVFEEISTWDKEYELGEVGLPSKKLWGKERGQRYFYDVFFRAFRQLMRDFENRGINTPSGIGLYEAVDEEPRAAMGKILRKTPFPEYDMGLKKSDGKKKLILQGSPHLPEDERMNKPSQLSKIINYLRPKSAG